MGLLVDGEALSWPDSKPYRAIVRSDGIEQFLSVYHDAKFFKDHDLRWGDEVEYLLVHVDDRTEKATLSLRGPELLEILQQEEHAQPEGSSVPVLWRPEYPKWMIEGTPGIPYRCYAADLVNVERNMALRRTDIAKILAPGEIVLTLTVFPRVGCGVFTTPPTVPFGPVSRSFFTSDDAISPHPRFPTLTENIRLRRGRKVHIEMPLFMDEHTPSKRPLIPRNDEHLALLQRARETLTAQGKRRGDPDFDLLEQGLQDTVGKSIVMDSAAFGMGACCLQVTLQGRNLSETRYLYDQLAVVAPLMLALTAATPILGGYLADTDVRWNVISAAMDDRTVYESESGTVPKSRYSSIDLYLSCRDQFKPESYNDVPAPLNMDAYRRLIDGGVDHMLARHVAHLFIRDPMVLYEGKIEQDNSTTTDHFENIQSTNWNTVRFKLPPPGTDIGWRTEFRSMEVGLTDFENAAFSVFTVILSRVILAFNLNFYIPMSRVDENMEAAHSRDAVRRRSFYFRRNLFTASEGSKFLCECGHIHNASLVGGQSECIDINRFCSKSDCEGSGSDSDCEPFESMTLDEIFNGRSMRSNGQHTGFLFPGLIPLMRGYLDALEIDEMTRARLILYLDFVSDKASGALDTNATYIRNFVRRHPSYTGNSEVSEEICHDLIQHLKGISTGDVAAPDLLGRYQKEGIYGEVETRDTMMARMQKKFVGPEATLLHGSSMPKWALERTLRSLATAPETGCRLGKCGC